MSVAGKVIELMWALEASGTLHKVVIDGDSVATVARLDTPCVMQQVLPHP